MLPENDRQREILFLDKYSLEEWSTLLCWSLGRLKPLYNNGWSCTDTNEYIWDKNLVLMFDKWTDVYLRMTDKKDLQIGRSLVGKYAAFFVL